MMNIISIILPTFIIFGVGFFLKKKFNTDIATLSNVSFNSLLPALVFKTFYTSNITKEIGWIILFVILLLFGIFIITFLFAKGFRFDGITETSLILGSSFSNAGNYGASIILLAYGQEGFEWALAFFVIQSFLLNSYGVLLAARGKQSLKKTLKLLFKMPVLYAGILGFLLQAFNIVLHPILYRPIETLSQAMIPILMILFGMQLAVIKKFAFKKGIVLGVFTRLIISPFLAFILLIFFPFNALGQKVFIIQSAMPAAVLPAILAIHYDTCPEMVSGIAFFSTLISGITISLLLFFFQ